MKTEFYFGRKLIMIITFLLSFISVEFSYAQTYCTPTITNMANYGMGMTNVQFGSTINNTSLGQTGNPPTVTDYTAQSVSQRCCFDVPFSLTAGQSNNSNISIWIDWNRDGNFNTTGNEFIFNSGLMNASTTITGSFKVPAGLATGNYRIRVGGDYGYYTPTPCANQYGEYEDYTFTVLPAGTPTLDVAMNAVVTPTQWQTGNNTLTVDFKSFGSTVINTVDLGYKLDNNTAVNVTGYTISGGLDICGTNLSQYQFATQVNLTTGSHKLKIWVNNPNGTSPDLNPNNDTLLFNFHTALSGTYTINPTTGYFKSVVEAANALATGGIMGPVKFDVQAGTYNGQVTLNNITGLSAANTITFDGGTGNAATRILQYTATSASNSHVFQLNNCNYVTIKNLKLVNNGASYGCGIHLMGICNYTTIKNNIITFGTAGLNSSGAEFTGIAIVNTNAVSSVTYCGSNSAATYEILIDSNTINGGGYGIQANTSGTNGAGVSALVISNNYFTNFYNGIVLSNNKGFSIDYNVMIGRSNANFGIIHCNGGTSGNQYYEFIGNQIYNVNSGIPVWSGNSGGTPRNKIINNLISTIGSGWGVDMGYDKNTDFWHNSIYASGATSVNSGCLLACQGILYANWSIRNNNFAMMNTGALGYALYFGVALSVPLNMVSVEWNNYYKANPANQNMIYNGGLAYNTSNMQGADGMNNKFLNKTPGFVSASNLHYDSTLVPIYGDPSLGITTDCDKDPRCAIAPTVGGDESRYRAPTPNTNFSAPDTIYKKNIADFINPSSASLPYLYKWYLNGALKATTLNWSNTFATANTYKVKLVASSYCGASDSTEKTLTVINPIKAPIADFLANANFARTIDNVYLYDQSLNGPLQWKWSIFPGTQYDPTTGANEATYRYVNSTTSSSQNPVIVLKYTGQYTICLIVSNSFGYDSICKQDFIVVRTAINFCSQTVTNSNYGVLYDDGGPTANYTNNKNCNILITPCSPNLSLNIKSFNLVTGDYLRIYDGVDNTGTKLYNTTLFPSGLTGDKSVTPAIPTSIVSQTGKIYMEYVTDAASVTSGFEIEWDGAPKVVSSPVASFTMSDTTVCKGRPIIFTNTSTGYGNKYYWDMDGDGIFDATTVNTTYTYQGAGSYEVSLIAENCGGIDTMRKVITVYSPTTKPVADFDADILNPGIGTDIVTFMDKSVLCADQWEWTFTPATATYRNATTKNSMNPQVSFNATGCYTVKLVASCNGNKDSITKTCFINVLNYCVPIVSTYSRDIGISRVLLGNINSVTDIASTGYTNYSKQYSTNMFITFPYTITIERLTAFNNISIYVWIDLNNDGDFFDPGEKVAFTNSNAGLTWSARFYIPATATEGKTRMRIGTNFENLPNLPCGVNLYGEFEDYLVNLQKDHQKPVITLIGAPSITIEAGTPYSDPGVIVTDNMDTNISSKIVTVNPVNTSVIDTYYVTYNVTDASGNVANQVTRRVIVTLDITPPQLTLLGLDTMYIEVYTPYIDPGYTSIDKPWGTNLTSKVVVTGTVDTSKVGENIITYQSTDAYGNIATKVRVVYVRDSQLPIITLLGSNPASMEVYHKFLDPGYIVTDNYCAPATLVPVITGNLDTSKLGTYNYIYQLTDCNGNGPVIVMRTVIVFDSTKPALSFNPGQDTIDVEVSSQFADPGISINDNYYTNLSPVISGTFYSTFPLGVPKTLGFYTIIYSVTDGSNNVGKITRVIHVVDTKAPVITLIGAELVTVKACQWPNYVDEGYTVTDNYYPVGSIIIDTVQKFTNSQDTGLLFKMQYKATDGSGNFALSRVRYIFVRGFSGVAEDMDRFIKVYPNPTDGRVTINIALPATEDISVRLFDVLGKEKLNIFQGNIQSKVISLDLTNQTKGVYFVRFTYSNESYNKMLIIR